MTPEEFRCYGYELVDKIADYRASIAQYPVMSTVEPSSIRAALPEAAPRVGEPFEDILADLDRIILPGISHWQHPSFFGYFPSNASLASVLGDLASSGFGVLGLSWQSSPALSEVEEVVVDWMRRLLGLSEGWGGVIQDSASTSTLVALLSARERASEYSLASGGLQGAPSPLVVYTTAHAHSSVVKAALLAGFGADNIREVATDGSFAMVPAELEAAIESDLAAGRVPCAVVASCGTTTTTAFDPLDDVGVVARAHRLWLHVDAAMAGSAMILPECRWMWNGVEHADSVVINAHKWLGVAFDCSLYFVRDPGHLVRVMSTNPSYLQSRFDGEVSNLRDWGIPLGRRFRALKLWFALRAEGTEAIRARLRRDLANAQWLAAAVGPEPHWRVLAPVALQTVCVVHQPEGLEGEDLDRHTLEWAEALNRSGLAYVTPAVLDGRWMVRVSIGALNTEQADVERLWLNMRSMAERSYATLESYAADTSPRTSGE